MSALVFFAAGTPRPKGSKRIGRNRAGKPILLEDSPDEANWRKSVTGAALAAVARTGHEKFVGAPLSLVLEFRFPRPKKHYRSSGELRDDAPRYHIGKPDASKLSRSVEDALNDLVWDDDSRVAMLLAVKTYAERDQMIGVQISVQRFGGSAPQPAAIAPQLTLMNGGKTT